MHHASVSHKYHGSDGFTDQDSLFLNKLEYLESAHLGNTRRIKNLSQMYEGIYVAESVCVCIFSTIW